jgi:hypothetical protein
VSPRLRGQRTVEQIDEELAQVRAEKRACQRAAGPFREVAHRGVDRLVEQAKSQLAGEVAGCSYQLPGIENPMAASWAVLHVLGSDSFAETLHAAVSEAPGFAEGTLAEHEAELARFDERIGKLEQERRDAEYQARKAELDAEFARPAA